MYVIAIVTGTAIILSVLKLTDSCVVYAFVHVCNSTVIDVSSMWLKQVSYIYIYIYTHLYLCIYTAMACILYVHTSGCTVPPATFINVDTWHAVPRGLTLIYSTQLAND